MIFSFMVNLSDPKISYRADIMKTTVAKKLIPIKIFPAGICIIFINAPTKLEMILTKNAGLKSADFFMGYFNIVFFKAITNKTPLTKAKTFFQFLF